MTVFTDQRVANYDAHWVLSEVSITCLLIYLGLAKNVFTYLLL